MKTKEELESRYLSLIKSLDSEKEGITRLRHKYINDKSKFKYCSERLLSLKDKREVYQLFLNELRGLD